MAMEHAFYAAGGLSSWPAPIPPATVARSPATADQRELELLVEAGFTPLEAIKIGTLNGATFEGRADHIGSIAPGTNADLVVVSGDPSKNINDKSKTPNSSSKTASSASTPKKLLDSVKGRYGQY